KQGGIAVETVSFIGLSGEEYEPKKHTLYRVARFLFIICAKVPLVRKSKIVNKLIKWQFLTVTI
ncbi:MULTISPECIES: hypothetical protein, partial [unclassified Moorena]|uniref:hypothetical protein n=1 Tax=unclassified Moorena TaxID=2683338 RepID=UPI0025EEAE78